MTMSPAEAHSATVAIPESGREAVLRQLRTEPGSSGGALESTGG